MEDESRQEGCEDEDLEGCEDEDLISDSRLRDGDVISPTRAVLTLSKSMFNSGCFSLPYAWKLGGKWVAFVFTFVIAGFNWYGNHILAKTSQHLAKRHGVKSLDYGHFAKRVCDYSEHSFLIKHSKKIMYVVNVTILFYQLGMCAVAILFISHNMVNLLGDYIGNSVTLMASIATLFILFTNLFTQMKTISLFAGVSSVFFILGTGVIMQYALQQSSKWSQLPGHGSFTDIIMFIGMSMYAYEGQTMVLPVENKLEDPDDFLQNFGVLPTTMCLCTIFMFALGFYGYNAFGDEIQSTITINVPKTGFYSMTNIFLMVQSMLGHSFALYVVFDMFFNGFKRKFTARFPHIDYWFAEKGFRLFWVLITYLMAILIPRLEVMIPLVGVTSGTLCALVYPPLFQMITFWDDWKINLTYRKRILTIFLNSFVIIIGIFAIVAGIYANILQMI